MDEYADDIDSESSCDNIQDWMTQHEIKMKNKFKNSINDNTYLSDFNQNRS